MKNLGLLIPLTILLGWLVATAMCFAFGYWPVGIILVVAGVIASETGDSDNGDCDPCMGA